MTMQNRSLETLRKAHDFTCHKVKVRQFTKFFVYIILRSGGFCVVPGLLTKSSRNATSNLGEGRIQMLEELC